MVTADDEAKMFILKDQNTIVPWVLMASYLYYCKDESLFSDEYYDQLTKELLLKWDEVEHSHKKLITKDDLMAGSLYKLKEKDYPSMCKGAAHHLMAVMKGERE